MRVRKDTCNPSGKHMLFSPVPLGRGTGTNTRLNVLYPHHRSDKKKREEVDFLSSLIILPFRFPRPAYDGNSRPPSSVKAGCCAFCNHASTICSAGSR